MGRRNRVDAGRHFLDLFQDCFLLLCHCISPFLCQIVTNVLFLSSSQTSPHGEDRCNRPGPDKSHHHYHHHHDNGISVRHIVTEIESISHPASSIPPSSSTSPSSTSASSRSPQPSRQETQEDRETGEVNHGSLTPPSYPQSPSTSPCDWPAGSVRRVTKQLEQRLKQELEVAAPHAAQRSPVHSPSTEHPPTGSPFLCSPSTETLPVRSPRPHTTEQTLSCGHGLTQGETAAVSDSAKPKGEETDTGGDSPRELHRLNSSDMDTLPDPSHSPNQSSIGEGSGTTPIIVDTSMDSHSLTQTEASSGPEAIIIDSSLATSPQSQPQPQTLSQNQSEPQIQSQASPKLLTLTLEGVTVQDSDTDGSQGSGAQGGPVDCGPSCGARGRLTRSSQELERIQQTLKELQAFLHEAGGLETGETMAQLEKAHLNQARALEQIQGLRGAMDKEAELGKGDGFEQASQNLELELGQGTRERQGKSFREPAGWQRATELEARIRQAGLTPPSLMKRSASLAKLDCLELSANDLSDWDLRSSPSSGTPSSNPSPMSPFYSAPHPYSSPDDTWKKQRVLVQIPPIEKTGWSHCGSGPDEPSSPLSLFPFSPSSHHHHHKEETGEEEETFSSRNATARQQGRGHSSRRSRKTSVDKKQRTVTVLYNTM